MSLQEYPQLKAIHEELTRLCVERSGAPKAAGGKGGVEIASGRDAHRVAWPGWGTVWLNTPQALVVKELLDALVNSASPECSESHLLRVAGVRGKRLREVFEGSRAWNALVLPGTQAGHYRALAPPGMRADEK